MKNFFLLIIFFGFVAAVSLKSQEVWIHQHKDTAHIITKYPAASIDSITVVPCDSSSANCCQFSLRLLNQVEGKFKKIRVTPINPSAITNVFLDEDFDGDNWSLTSDPNGAYYEFTYLNGFIPASADLIDEDFTIQINHSIANPVIVVDWLDNNGSIQKEEQITLACISDPRLGLDDYTYDWPSYTKQIHGSYTDEEVFAGAEAEPCQGTGEYKSLEISCGSITHNFVCESSQPTLKLIMSAPTGGEIDNSQPLSYQWNVNGSTGIGSNFSYPINGSGNVSINITCNVYGYVLVDHYDTDGNYNGTTSENQLICSQNDYETYCVPTAEFLSGTPEPVCDQGSITGWKVTFDPINQCDIGIYKWDWGDTTSNSDGSGDLGETDHIYTQAGTYTVTLSAEDVNGCKVYTFSSIINISNECTPNFHANYEWCQDSTIFKNKQYLIDVTFTNQSNHFCNTTYTWDFGDGSPSINSTSSDAVIYHSYNTYPNATYTVTLKMTDPNNCPDTVTISHQIMIKPIVNGMTVTVCGDGIVKFSNPTGRNHWSLPNWQALVNDPSYYCLPVPFDPLLNIEVNGILGLMGTSIPQIFVNKFNVHNFELRFKEDAMITVTDSSFEDPTPFITGLCIKTITVTNTITCCPDFSVKQFAYKTMGSHDYRMKKKFKIHYRERHGDQNIGSCWDYYASFFVDEKTHLRAKTVFSVHKKAKIGNVTLFQYWMRSPASEIEAGVSGNFMSKDPTTGCNCGQLETWNNNSTNHNRAQVAYRENTPSLYKTNKTIEVKSFHRVVKNGVTWDSSTDGTGAEIVKPIGSCSPQ